MKPATLTCLLICGGLALLLRCSGSPVAGGDVTETGNARIACTVRSPGGVAVAGARVTVRTRDYLTPPGISKTASSLLDTVTGRDGRFEFNGVDFGDYTVEINDLTANALLLTCSVVHGVTDIDFGDTVLMPRVSVSGSVPLPPDSGASLFVQVYGLERLVPVDRADGSFTIDDLPAGNYRFRIVSANPLVQPSVIANVEARSGSLTLPPFAAWAHCAKLVINTSETGANIDRDVVGFPLLVRLDRTMFAMSESIDRGADIRFARPDGTPLAHEIESWDTYERTAAIWVLADTVHAMSDSQYIMMYWGQPYARSVSSASAVFDTALGFAGAWHFSRSAPYADATQNANDAVDGATGAATGVIGPARYFGGSDSMYVPDNASLEPQSLTLSCWFKRDGAQDSVAKVVNKGLTSHAFLSYTLEMRQTTDVAGFQIATVDTAYHTAVTGNEIADGAWYLLTGVFNAETGAGELFLNGQSRGAFTTTQPIEYYTQADYPLYFGCQMGGHAGFKGYIDEIRLSCVPRSSSWVRLCYETQKEGAAVVTLVR